MSGETMTQEVQSGSGLQDVKELMQGGPRILHTAESERAQSPIEGVGAKQLSVVDVHEGDVDRGSDDPGFGASASSSPFMLPSP